MATNVNAVFSTTYGRLAFGSVLVGYSTLLALTETIGQMDNNVGGATILYFFNTLNNDVILSLDNGTTDWCYLPAGTNFSIDLRAGQMRYLNTIKVKYATAASTVGAISVSVVRSQL